MHRSSRLARGCISSTYNFWEHEYVNLIKPQPRNFHLHRKCTKTYLSNSTDAGLTNHHPSPLKAKNLSEKENECVNQVDACLMMWVGNGPTPWFHGVPTVMTRGAYQISVRVAGQFSHFSQVERHMAYTVVPSIFSSGRLYQSKRVSMMSVEIDLTPNVCMRSGITSDLREGARSGICFYLRPFASEMSLAYKWLYLSWKQLLPLFSFTVGISASVQVRMMYAGVSDPHLPQWMMWVGNGLTPWFHGVPTVMTRGAYQISVRVAGQFSHFSQSKVRITLNISVCTLNSSVICPFLKSGIVFVTRVIYHWNQRISESQYNVSCNRTTPGLSRSGICFYLRPFASEMSANYAKV
ncbi:hypothetical protein PROFUN_15922 [Planoprotostelium fungivorum]|uniref:Uncharacterized protein n=1 Tax=Planoprotostelium fungivorum TaxID=1890364 RepID=A0A2P6MT79_9EUKA|nr:hypothetical protein PROFUN_15922 [Planoprotostelium fungivorum]